MALAMVISSISVLSFGQQTKSEAASGSFQNLNQSQFVSAMGAGWNLGNQLEAANNGVPSETAWGNPTITENLIKAVKNAGFTSIRIPVSYMGHIGSDSNYTVDAGWLNRVQQVVDMCVNMVCMRSSTCMVMVILLWMVVGCFVDLPIRQRSRQSTRLCGNRLQLSSKIMISI